MNKKLLIIIGIIWFIVFSIVLMGVLVSPDIDVLKSLQRYKILGQQYLDREVIDPAAVEVKIPDDEFLVMYAKYLLAFQKSENEWASKQRTVKVALDAQNLNNPELYANTQKKLNELSKQTQISYDRLLDAQNQALKTVEALKEKDLEVYAQALDQVITEIEGNEAKFRDDVTKARLALDKYYQAIFDFVVQKQGMYSVQGSLMSFFVEEEQVYYDQLREGQKEFERQLSRLYDDYKQDLRQSNSKIPVDIK